VMKSHSYADAGPPRAVSSLERAWAAIAEEDDPDASGGPTSADLSSSGVGVPVDPLPGFARMPGVLCRSEISQVIRPGAEFYLESAGELKGVEVFHVFHRSRSSEDIGIPATVVLDDGTMPLRARLLPISTADRDPFMAILTVERGGDTLGRVRDHLARAGVRFHTDTNTTATSDVQRPER